jgi:hypothetical protein
MVDINLKLRLKKNQSFLVLIITSLVFFLNISFVHGQPVNFTLDFETGDLRGWTKKGNAFDYQPTLGDNPTARHRGQPSNHQGKYWIGTYEKYQGKSEQKSGNIQGDRPTGSLTSAPFTIPSGILSFLIGGGSSFETRVELVIIDPIEQRERRVYHASGKDTETMHRVKWDITPYANKTGRIRIVDTSSGGWGHINVDDFRFTAVQGVTTPVIPAFRLEQKVEVPDLVRRNVSEAERVLNRVKLRLGEIIKKPSNQKLGTILRQSPVAHSKVERGTPINIWVAESEMVEVPNLVGQSIGQAKEILKETRLQFGNLIEEISNRKAGIVFRQDPIAGTKVIVDSPVNLWIAAKREKPVAKINPGYKKVVQGEKIIFKSQSTPAAEIREKWRGPNNQIGTGSRFEVLTDQLNPGQYEIVLAIMDSQEQSDKAFATLEVTPPEIIPIEYRVFLETEPNRTETGKTVIFRARVEQPTEKIGYRFIFGDGKVRDWSNEAMAEHSYSESGNYHAYVVARIDHNIMPESNPVMLTIIKPSLKIPWILIIVGSLSVLAGGYYLFSRIRKAGKAIKDVTPEIQIKPHRDTGIQQIESDTNIQSDFEIRLKPILDHGKQDIEAEGSLIIGERRDHE